MSNSSASSVIKMIKSKPIFWDNSGNVELWDFSKANLSLETRIQAITQVASVCYQSPKALGSESLYNRLLAESIGLPSSSFEFVPVLLNLNNPKHKEIFEPKFSNVRKYGECITEGWFLTNYRALVYDWEHFSDLDIYSYDIRDTFNTEEECGIIKEFFSVFFYTIDFATRSQMVRHRVNWQELSRRYVSGKKLPFVPYFDEKTSAFNGGEVDEFYASSISLYNKLINSGIKPEKARRVIPVGTLTFLWGGFMPSQLSNFLSLRTKGSAQDEVRDVADTMKLLLPFQSENQSEKNLLLIGKPSCCVC